MVMVSAFHMHGKVLADRYEVGRTIEGERLVCHGTDRRGGTPVAIHLYADPTREDPAAFARLQALVEPSLVRILAVGVQDHTSYMVTEALDGYFLADELRGGPLAAQRILALAARVCEAIAVLHANEISHGELTTTKVYVGRPDAPDDLDTTGVKIAPPSTVRTATPSTIAADVEACRTLIGAMLEPDAIAPLREVERARAKTATELAQQCRDALATLPISDRRTIGIRPKPPVQPRVPQDIPMPTNWSPPPPPREFSYGAPSPSAKPSQPPPAAIVVRPPRDRAVVLGVGFGLVLVIALLVWLVR